MTSDEKIAYCLKKGYSHLYALYWTEHPGCEACGRPSDAPHHIRTRGAGGKDEYANLLALCPLCHREVERGRTIFCQRHPRLKQKIDEAFDRSRT